jgi:hypothetical protein
VLRHPPGLCLSSPRMGPSRCGHTVTMFSAATLATWRAPPLHSMRFTHRRPTGSTCHCHHRMAMATLRPTDLVIRHLPRHPPPAPLLQQFQTMGLQAPGYVMDTGASSHFASDPSMITSVSPSPPSSRTVIVGNGSSLRSRPPAMLGSIFLPPRVHFTFVMS